MTGTLLSAIPSGLRDPLVDALGQICRNYAERRWEPSELNGGKLCEVVFTILEGTLTGKFASAPSKPKKMAEACRALEGMPADPSRTGDRSLRVFLPRMLIAIYDIRNNRGVGHVGGDVNPNFLDATVVHTMARWVVADLIRIFHHVSLEEAQVAVDALIERKIPIVWERDGIRRVLDTGLSMKEQVLVLAYSCADWITCEELLKATEYSNHSKFKNELLLGLHKERLIEFDRVKDRICLTPLGTAEVESKIIRANNILV